MTEQSLDRAVTDLEGALADLDLARKALSELLDDHMQSHPQMATAYCILKTLDQAEEQGRAAWTVLWEARPLNAGERDNATKE